MTDNYAQQLCEMQMILKGDENEQRLRNFSNYIMAFGRLYEKKGSYKKEVLNILVEEIQTYKEEWAQLETMILNHLDEYMKNGINSKHTMQYNDICLGTLKLLTEVYKNGKDLTYLNHDRLNKMLKNMESISANTFEEINRKQFKKSNDCKNEHKFNDGARKSDYSHRKHEEIARTKNKEIAEFEEEN